MPHDPFQYEVRNPEVEKTLKNLGRLLKETMPPGYGFTLMMFGYKNDEMFYMSSAEREDMIKVMREFIEKFGAN
jgi:hypothetical protein